MTKTPASLHLETDHQLLSGYREDGQPIFDSGVAPDQLFAGRAAVCVGFELIDEVSLAKAPVGRVSYGQKLVTA